MLRGAAQLPTALPAADHPDKLSSKLGKFLGRLGRPKDKERDKGGPGAGGSSGAPSGPHAAGAADAATMDPPATRCAQLRACSWVLTRSHTLQQAGVRVPAAADATTATRKSTNLSAIGADLARSLASDLPCCCLCGL